MSEIIRSPGLQLSRESRVTRTGADHLVKIFLVRSIDMAHRLTKISDGMPENSKASLNIPLTPYLPVCPLKNYFLRHVLIVGILFLVFLCVIPIVLN